MKVFYGGAIQGSQNRGERAHVHQFLISAIKECGFGVYTEHTGGNTYEESKNLLEEAIGKLPEEEFERRVYVRNKMIEGVEGDVSAIIFEVSEPSLGTGIEIGHAYLRPRLGLNTVPILALYQKGFWKNKLSTMVRGLSPDKFPYVTIVDYDDLEHAKEIIKNFLKNI